MDIVFNNASCQVTIEDIVISEEINRGITEVLRTNSREYTLVLNGDLYSFYRIHKTRALQVVLIVTTDAPLSKLNAYLVSGLLQIYHNFCDVLRDGQTDQLTGLFNRKTFDESVNKVFGLVPVDSDPHPGGQQRSLARVYWLVMVDIDHFKVVNDRFGHLFGDEVLVLLAQKMMSTFREDDLIFRFGGEEFVLILRSPDQAGCRTALERFRQAIENFEFPQVGKVTISLGACRMSRDIFTATLLDYADKALYYSKHNGRNQVTFFEDLVEAGVETIQEIEAGEITLF